MEQETERCVRVSVNATFLYFTVKLMKVNSLMDLIQRQVVSHFLLSLCCVTLQQGQFMSAELIYDDVYSETS